MRVRRIFLIVAKMNETVRDVGVASPSPAELAVGIDTTSSIMNVWLPEGGYTENVVVPFQITVWVANYGFGVTVRNALLGDTR